MNSMELAWKIRRHAIEMTHRSGASHIGAILSIADIVAVLYSTMRIFPEEPENDLRDRFILSKGHAGAAIYAVLAESGFFPLEDLKSYYANGSRLSGHISHKEVPGVEISTGSLGHGICVGAGMALAAKMDEKRHHVYVVVGDGECDEGSVWEAALFANHFRLKNFTVIVDHNKFQGMGPCESAMELLNLAAKWAAFGWRVIEIDGHNHEQLRQAMSKQEELNDKPVCIIAHTIKGKGISFMENQILWHYRDPQDEFYERAVRELEKSRV